jgi:hypothetical protein
LRKEYANYLKTYQDELENTKALEVKKLADDSKVQVYQERIGILQAARNDHDENLKSAIAGIHDRTTSLVGMFETRMGPIDAMRKQEFMADLHDIYALDVKAYADAIRSLGNFLANYAGTGAGATLSTSVGHLSLLA